MQNNELSLYSPYEMIIKLKKLIKHIEKVQAEMDGKITHAQARIIFPIIRDDKGYTIQELADIGGVTKGLVSRAIADLENKGYVERDKKTLDQDRNYKIILSAKGQEFIAEKKLRMHEVSNKWNGKITHDDLKTFVKVLNLVTEV